MSEKKTTTKNLKDFQNPGEALNYYLERNDWTQEDLAYILSVSLKHTNEIIKNKKPVSFELAKLLQNAFKGTTQEEWINLSTRFQLSQSKEDNKGELVKLRATLSEYMPLNELMKKGWIGNYSTKEQLESQMRKFWSTPTNNAFDIASIEKRVHRLKFKTSEKFNDNFNAYHAVIWAQMVENFAKSTKVSGYDRSGLKALMDTMHGYTFAPNGVKKFMADLASVGVKFVFLSHLTKTYLDGAAFKADDSPIVALTGRYDRIDNFWFTLAHELSHVYYHLSDEFIFMDDSTSIGISKEEIQANKSAEELLLLPEVLDFLKDYLNYLTVDKVIDCSNQLQLHSSIIVGMLAHRDYIAFSNLHRFKEPVRNQIPKKYCPESGQ